MVWNLVFRFALGIVLAVVCGFWQSGLSDVVEPSYNSRASQPGGIEKASSPSSRISQAFQHYSLGQYREAIALWEGVLQADGKQTLLSLNELGDIHVNLGAAYRKIGQLPSAIDRYRQAVELYFKAGNSASRGMVLVDLASAYNAIGQSRGSISMLTEAIEIARKTELSKLEAVAFGVLGTAYSETGQLDKAVDALSTSLKGVPAENVEAKVIALNNLGNVFLKRAKRYKTIANNALTEGDAEQATAFSTRSQSDEQAAIAAFEEAVAITKSTGGLWEVNSAINLARAKTTEFTKPTLPATEIERLLKILDNLPNSRSKAYALINTTFIAPDTKSQIRSLEQARSVAKNIGDSQTESYALGILGHTHELLGNVDAALEKTRNAVLVAQQVNAQDSLYRWQWQAGRILASQGNTQQAIVSYKRAIATLQTIRGDIIAESVDLQFDVRDEVEPVYRELIGLLLDGKPTQSNIKQALEVSQLLKLTELQDYFGDECIQVQDLKNTDARPSNTSTATIYSIILADKAYTILRLTNGDLKSYPVAMKARELDAKILQFRTALEDVATNDYWALSNELYDLLIRPAEGELAAANPKALVFVNDGLLRNVPMAALHDGKQFLVEKYPIAINLGFNLSFPQRMQQKNQALIFGLTVEIGPFAPLPSVATETQRVQEIVGGSRFLDSEFTLSNLQKQLQARTYPILHLATHGKFGATADTTFLQAFDTRVTLQQFEKLLANLKQPVDLLTLSACQTAAGDNRSTLGLAGVAVRNGIKNVLASLWSVNDAETVELVEKFYNYLRQPAMSPADSLRRAQLELIANFRSHPANWSSFILIGDNL